MASKSKAADWGFQHARGARRHELPQAKALRLNPGLMQIPETKHWLESLAVPIQSACEELAGELPPA